MLLQVESCRNEVSVVVAGHGRHVAVIVLQYNFTTSKHSFVMVRTRRDVQLGYDCSKDFVLSL